MSLKIVDFKNTVMPFGVNVGCNTTMIFIKGSSECGLYSGSGDEALPVKSVLNTVEEVEEFAKEIAGMAKCDRPLYQRVCIAPGDASDEIFVSENMELLNVLSNVLYFDHEIGVDFISNGISTYEDLKKGNMIDWFMDKAEKLCDPDRSFYIKEEDKQPIIPGNIEIVPMFDMKFPEDSEYNFDDVVDYYIHSIDKFDENFEYVISNSIFSIPYDNNIEGTLKEFDDTWGDFGTISLIAPTPGCGSTKDMCEEMRDTYKFAVDSRIRFIPNIGVPLSTC